MNQFEEMQTMELVRAINEVDDAIESLRPIPRYEDVIVPDLVVDILMNYKVNAEHHLEQRLVLSYEETYQG